MSSVPLYVQIYSTGLTILHKFSTSKCTSIYSTGLTISLAFSTSLCTSIQYGVHRITCIQQFFMYKYTVRGSPDYMHSVILYVQVYIIGFTGLHAFSTSLCTVQYTQHKVHHITCVQYFFIYKYTAQG